MFKINSEDLNSNARCGELITSHGRIQTPFFMPVATKGTVKWINFEQLHQIGFECFISNSFILSKHPGLEVIKKSNGFHNFISWDKGIFTDSGGFQLLDENFLHKVTDKGVWLKDPFNGDKELLTPQKSAEIQSIIGSDVAMVLDDVRHPYREKKEHIEAVKNTLQWAKEFHKIHSDLLNQKNCLNKKQLKFAIVQGGLNLDLRKKCAEGLVAMNFDGYALGGLCIGESREEMLPIIKKSIDFLPKEAPRYLMGVGTPKDLLEAIAMGVDCFDSAFPTKSARHGYVFNSSGNYQIEKKDYVVDLRPLDEECGCFVCRNHSRAFIRHLLKSKEETAFTYLSFHNLHYVNSLVKEARTHIAEGSFSRFLKEFSKIHPANKNY